MRNDPHGRQRRPTTDPRRRPADGYRARDAEAFWRLVDRAVDSLPGWVVERMDNVQITVADVPDTDEVLLGLYEGVPQTERSDLLPMLPDRITLFRRPLEHRARNRAELANLVRDTVIHEVAHHFGIDDDWLDEHGY